MIGLEAMLTGCDVLEIKGNPEREIEMISLDSRHSKVNGLFIAVRGTQTDGHKFIENALEKKVAAVVCEVVPRDATGDVTWVLVKDSSVAAGVIAHNFYGKPTEKLRLVGVTGTNGKSTTVTLLYGLMQRLGRKAGLISTIENRIAEEQVDAILTTPDPVSLNQLLGKMVEKGCEFAFMEVSSHAVDQNRIAGLSFAGGVFTNITHDHLDYHGSFRRYIEAKKKFFDRMGAHAFALVNADDPRGQVMVQNTSAKVSKFSLEKVSEFRARVLSDSPEGLQLNVDGIDMMSRLVGRFNAYNLLACYATAVLLGFEQMEVVTALSALGPAEGRFEMIRHQQKRIYAVVDYAHTPDALEKVLSTLLHLKVAGGRILAVVGCGGDRDRQKRPVMGKLAAGMADLAIFTSDNPRSEDPDRIIDEMEGGVEESRRNKVLRIVNRKEAIRTAIKMATGNDIILVAGKGHEKYQIIGDQKLLFDDKAIIIEAFKDI